MENLFDVLLLIGALIVFGLALEHITTGIKSINVLGLRLREWGFQIALIIAVGVCLSYGIDLTDSVPDNVLPSLPPDVAETVTGLLVAWVSSWVHDRFRAKEPKPFAVLPTLLAGKSK